ncbi:hypothetical protein [Alkalihalophilus marmarensis]|uniref:hypothetical protein n=1 Tax=Alkalihalophilus marmarensis TaxID=521377 RepID=UPI002DBDCC48|nr:hypothetical protein [Alkalihalophilus marmarensis]MEC2074239.1 hypothetical protein [Alkalihalophilus marmarensis]MEC2074471.1 hypothetical protein [Alkalihalophilus marmarensis]
MDWTGDPFIDQELNDLRSNIITCADRLSSKLDGEHIHKQLEDIELVYTNALIITKQGEPLLHHDPGKLVQLNKDIDLGTLARIQSLLEKEIRLF